jgi:hypothetical protein
MTYWEKPPKKCIFTLCVDNYAPEITEITFPLLKRFADKIRAEFYVIKERRYPLFPPVYEKLQIYRLGQEMQNDWNWYIDADALVHPDMMDITNLIPKDTVMHNGNDHAGNRWLYDRYFRRDGRNIGSCNWFTLASDWCIELWKPLDDLTLEEAVARISPTVNESKTIITADHLIDDYTLSRNIAKYGFKFKNFEQLKAELGREKDQYLYHEYTIPIPEKVIRFHKVLTSWGLM